MHVLKRIYKMGNLLPLCCPCAIWAMGAAETHCLQGSIIPGDCCIIFSARNIHCTSHKLLLFFVPTDLSELILVFLWLAGLTRFLLLFLGGRSPSLSGRQLSLFSESADIPPGDVFMSMKQTCV